MDWEEGRGFGGHWRGCLLPHFMIACWICLMYIFMYNVPAWSLCRSDSKLKLILCPSWWCYRHWSVVEIGHSCCCICMMRSRMWTTDHHLCIYPLCVLIGLCGSSRYESFITRGCSFRPVSIWSQFAGAGGVIFTVRSSLFDDSIAAGFCYICLLSDSVDRPILCGCSVWRIG